MTQAMMSRFHEPVLTADQFGSNLVQRIDAPLSLVWSMVRRFDNPQAYKQFVKSSTLCGGYGGIGSVRDVMVISSLPAGTSTERLDKLDDDMHVMVFSIIGGDHRLLNYRSTKTLHEEEEEKGVMCTVVIVSYVVDVPVENSKEDTCTFADTIIGCNLRSSARMTENMSSITN